MYRELMIGCGNNKARQICAVGGDYSWKGLTTLDIDPDCHPDVEHDLESLPLPFPENHFNEVHAYHVLEHTGQQGDWKFYFAQFSDLWRIMKPDALLFIKAPALSDRFLWGDPGHTRVISVESLTFLNQDEYTKQIGITNMTDYRHVFRADFSFEKLDERSGELIAVLHAMKPSRILGT